MENKVAHNSDLNIEEMVEKLKKVSVLTRMYIGNDIVIVTGRPIYVVKYIKPPNSF